MSRLDSFIRRMQAQRDCLNHVAGQVHGMPGPILELGLGNGRTYDHLRQLFPEREIFVFEREVRAHPDCIPPEQFLFKGDIGDTLPEAAARLGPTAILAHTDLGTGDKAANAALGEFLGPALDRLMAPGGLVLANQKLHVGRWTRLPEPPDVKPDRYFIYRVG
ncbi:MAG: class I SAM-dependent methyltransferase [Reyranellaceae bacterium]